MTARPENDDRARQASLAWRGASGVLAITVVALLLLYRETALSMAVIWARSGTFTHGFFVPLISLGLIWRQRGALAAVAPRPDYRMLPLFAVAVFAWMMGQMATVGPISQFALTAMIVLAVPAVVGADAARTVAFPLGFLFFAVPFGEFAMPQLMEWTADVTVLGLRASGVPVYREGLHFVIPSGAWSVAEACSGVRYLIASLMVGTLFAYLTYRSTKRRLLFVAVAALVPIVANWARAYLIVMLGHLSGNKLAAGVDHLIYGWVFFGFVILAMFWIGSRWREDTAAPPGDGTEERPPMLAARPIVVPALVPVAAAAVLIAALGPFAADRIERAAPPDVTRIEAIPPIAGWMRAGTPLTDWEPVYRNAPASLHESYGIDAGRVGLYIAYYRNEGPDRKLVTSVNALVTNEDRRWIQVADGVRDVRLDGRTLPVRTAELRGGDGSRLVVWRWYWIGGRVTRSDVAAKALAALNKLRGQGDDAAVIVIYAPRESEGGADAWLGRFAAAALPSIESALQKTGSRR